jgi:hypothetical protein
MSPNAKAVRKFRLSSTWCGSPGGGNRCRTKARTPRGRRGARQARVRPEPQGASRYFLDAVQESRASCATQVILSLAAYSLSPTHTK